MKRAPAPRGGLADAHDRLEGLLGDLNETVDLVERLTREGDHEAALRIVEAQRSALYSAIDEVSYGIGRPARWWEPLRQRATAVAAALALILSSAAVAIGLSGGGPSLIDQANAHIAEAEQAADPATRLQIIERIVIISRSLPPESAQKVAADVAPLIDRVRDEVDDGGGDEDLEIKAEKLHREVERARTNPPTSPPSSGRSPVEDAGEALDELSP